jgi:hypothetical protein
MKKIFVILFVIGSLSLFAACDKSNQGQGSEADTAALLQIHDFSGKGIIQDENIPVRSAPDDTDPDNIIGTLARDVPVTITKRKGKQSIVDQSIVFWYEVSDGKIKGWVFGHAVALQQ